MRLALLTVALLLGAAYTYLLNRDTLESSAGAPQGPWRPVLAA